MTSHNLSIKTLFSALSHQGSVKYGVGRIKAGAWKGYATPYTGRRGGAMGRDAVVMA